MGVQGLWQILEPSGQTVTLESLEGKRLAVDISIWLHQAVHGFSAHGNDARKPHLVLILNRVAKLLFYKVRPVFVFDGDQIPVYKLAVLRERQIKKAVDAMTVSKQTKRVLAEVASGVTDPKKLKFAPVPEDIMNLEELEVELSVPSTSTYRPDAFLDGYTSLLNRDEKIAFLADAKQRIKKTKLNDADIPSDATDFHKFQTDRILQRARINDEIEMIRNEKASQAAQLLSSQKLRGVIIDAHAGSHILTYEKSKDVSTPEKPKMSDKPLVWTQFVKQIRQQYYRDEDKEFKDVKPNVEVNASKPDEFLEVWKESDSEDEELASKFFAIETKARNKCQASNDSPSSSIKRNIVKLPRKTNTHEASDSDDFEDVLLDEDSLPPASASGVLFNLDADANSANVQFSKDFLESDDVDDAATELNFETSNNDTQTEMTDPRSLYGECQRLLNTLGLPYFVAPGEAEAQCAEFERLGLVEGTITDDSDIWLFGGRKVYKNMFSKITRERFYDANLIESQIGLCRFDCIELTMLAGGDYTRGFEGVGMVSALEILAEFGPRCIDFSAVLNADDTFASLERVRTWLLAKSASKSQHFIESQTRIRLRKTIERGNDIESIKDFPNRAVFDAYCNPTVSSKSDQFKWKRITFSELEEFVWEMLGWTEAMLHKKTYDALKKWDSFLSQSTQSYQTRILSFTVAPKASESVAGLSKSVDVAPTQRVQAALNKLFKVKGMGRNQSPEPSTSSDAKIYAQIHSEIQKANSEKKVHLKEIIAKKQRKPKKIIKKPIVLTEPKVVEVRRQGLSEDSSDSDWN